MTKQSYNNYIANLTYYHSVLGESVANSIKLGKCDLCKVSTDLMISDAMITVLSQYILPEVTSTSTATGQVIYSDWHLPARDDYGYMYTNLHLVGIGGFQNDTYWSSSEVDATKAWSFSMVTGWNAHAAKVSLYYVRPVRIYQSSTTYTLGGYGEAGGYIYHIDTSTMPYTYYECALTDLVAGQIVWSNITTLSVGITTTATGTGLANSQLIVAQAGHVTSAALSCLTYSVNGYGIVGTLVGTNYNPLTVEQMQAITAMLNKIHGTIYCVDYVLTTP